MRMINKILVSLLWFLLIGHLALCQDKRDTTIHSCTIGAYSIKFYPGSKSLPDIMKPHLKLVAKMMKENINCKLIIGSCCGGNKQTNQLSWDRVNALIRYFIEKEGLTEDRFAFGYDIAHEIDTVVFQGESISHKSRPPSQ